MIKMSIESTEVAIALLSNKEIDRAAALMASAFANDPLVNYLLPKAQNRPDVIRWFWREALQRNHQYGHSYTTAPGFWGVASWLPPGVPRETIWTLWPLVLQGWLQTGWQSSYRLLSLLECAEKLRDRYCSKPHWCLDGLAVAPESQGKGIGGLLLQPALALADQEGKACCLYTSTEGAVRFYQRLGFVVCEEIRFQREAPPLWLMVRSPKVS